MGAMFDYSKSAGAAGVSPEQLEQLERCIRQQYGSDEMLIELRMLRTLRAVQEGAVSIDDAIRDLSAFDDLSRLNSFLGQGSLSDSERDRVRYFVTRELSRIERLIVILHYYERKTLAEIGRTLNMPENQVRATLDGVLERLRGRLGLRLAARAFGKAS